MSVPLFKQVKQVCRTRVVHRLTKMIQSSEETTQVFKTMSLRETHDLLSA